jgi:flagellar basal-body rod protein FlgG
MIQQFYISTTALSAYQKMMINITNDVANAQTPGYKGSRVELEALFPGMLEDEVQNQYGSNAKKKKVYYGSGVKIADILRDFQQGRVEITGKPLDLAINGKGFFQFRLPDGSIGYGRAGNLQKDRNGYLVDPNGNMLSPSIRIPSGTTSVSIDGQGRVFVQENESAQSREIGQITLAQFENPNALQSIGHNMYLETTLSGPPSVYTPGDRGLGQIQQNSLELSNVNVVKKMMEMVIVQRSFTLAANAIQSGNEMLKAAEEIAKGS